MKYKWVSFLSKVAFLCNLCFLLVVVVRYTHDFISNQSLKSTVIILGTAVSLLINIILQVSLMILRMTKKDIQVKAWLRIFNAVAFALQIILYFLMPGN